jgi:hypothetical protein
MKTFSIEDLLIGQFYRPSSLARKFMGGEIDYATKRDDVWVGTDYQAIRFAIVSDSPLNKIGLLIAVKVND